MIYVSFVELLPSGVDALEEISRSAHTTAVVALFVGMLLVAVIDRLVPLGYNPHEMRPRGTLDSPGSQGSPSSAADSAVSGSAETSPRRSSHCTTCPKGWRLS